MPSDIIRGASRDFAVDPASVAATATRSSHWALIGALAVYAVVVAFIGIAQREQLNSDAVCYLRNAFYLSEGRWSDSVSGYWSPVLSWSIVPFLWLKMDGVYAGHLAMAIWGAVFIGAVYCFLRIFTRLTRPWDVIVMIVVALKTVAWTTRLVTPDLVLAAFLLLYSAVTLLPGFLASRRYQIAAGVIGGLAYLAKSYGLPFFLVHLTAVMAARYWLERGTVTWKQALRGWGMALLAFLLVAGPWIGLLSLKYGRLTFSTVAKVAHTVVGPQDKPRGHPTEELRTPPAGRLTVWETPDILPYNHWSPLENRAYFRHQVKLVVQNVEELVNSFAQFDLLGLFPGLLLILPMLLLSRRGSRFQHQTGWTLLTLGIYAGGFLPIYYESRYVAPFLWPICFFYLFDVFAREQRVLVDAGSSERRTSSALAALCMILFTVPALYDLQLMVRAPSTPAWRHLAERLQELGCEGPLAVSPGAKSEGMLVSYLNSQPFLGPVAKDDVRAAEKGLEKFGAKTLLVRDAKWPLAQKFRAETRWKLRETFKEEDIIVFIFTPPVP